MKRALIASASLILLFSASGIHAAKVDPHYIPDEIVGDWRVLDSVVRVIETGAGTFAGVVKEQGSQEGFPCFAPTSVVWHLSGEGLLYEGTTNWVWLSPPERRCTSAGAGSTGWGLDPGGDSGTVCSEDPTGERGEVCMSMTRVSEPPSVDDFTPSGFELFVGLLRRDGNGWARTFGDWLSVVQKAFDGWAFKEQLEDLLRTPDEVLAAIDMYYNTPEGKEALDLFTPLHHASKGRKYNELPYKVRLQVANTFAARYDARGSSVRDLMKKASAAAESGAGFIYSVP